MYLCLCVCLCWCVRDVNVALPNGRNPIGCHLRSNKPSKTMHGKAGVIRGFNELTRDEGSLLEESSFSVCYLSN